MRSKKLKRSLLMKFNWNKITISIMLISSGFAFYSFNKKNENRINIIIKFKKKLKFTGR